MISDADAEKFGEIDLSRISTGHGRGGKTEFSRSVLRRIAAQKKQPAPEFGVHSVSIKSSETGEDRCGQKGTLP